MKYIKKITGEKYYADRILRMLFCSEKLLQESREHWEKIHAENVRADRDDLKMFSAKNLVSCVIAGALRHNAHERTLFILSYCAEYPDEMDHVAYLIGGRDPQF